MKLHLPCALRGALLAAFALSCTSPAWAGSWNGNTYVLTEEDVANTALMLTTATGNPDEKGWFLRTTTGGAVVDGAKTASISTLTLNKPGTTEDSDNYTLNIQGHWENADAMFTNLRIGRIMAGAEFTKAAPAKVNIAASNVVSLGNLEVSTTEVQNMSDGIQLSVSGTLNLNFYDFAGVVATNADGTISTETFEGDSRQYASYSGGLADAISGEGTIVLWGEVVWDYAGEGILWSANCYDTALTNVTQTLDFSNITIRFRNGYSGSHYWDSDDGMLRVFAYEAALERLDQTPTADPTLKAAPTISDFTSVRLGELSDPTNASKEWTLTLTGTLTNPGSTNKDVILLSSHQIDTADANGNYAPGQFCLYIDETGSVYLHNKENAANAEETREFHSILVATLDDYATGDWEHLTYSTTLTFSVWSTYRMLTLGALSIDGLTMNPTGRSNIMIDAAPDATALDNLWVRLPGGSSTNLSVNKDSAACGGAVWVLNSGTSVEELRARETDALESSDVIRFENTMTLEETGGILRSGEGAGDVVTVDNPIEATGNAYVKLAPEAGTTLILTKGNGALDSGRGLVIMGGQDSMVELRNVSEGEKKNINIHANNTLVLSSSVNDIIIDGAENTINPLASLIMKDGGKLTYIAKTDDSINLLANVDGKLVVQKALLANDIAAKTLILAGNEDKLTVAGTTSVTALELGTDETDNMAGLTTNRLVASSVKMGEGTGITAHHATITTLNTNSDSEFALEGEGSVQVTGNAIVKGSLKSDNICMSGLASYTFARNILLTANSMSADMLSFVNVHIGAAESGIQPFSLDGDPVILEFGTVDNSTITGNRDTIIRNSHFVYGNAITFTAGKLTVENSTFDGKSSIGHVQEDAAITLRNITMDKGSSIIAGTTTYTMGDGVPALTLSGTATAGTLSLSGLIIDISDAEGATNGMLIDSGDGKVDMNGCALSFYTAPGYVATTAITSEGDLVFSTENKGDELFSEIATSANSQAAKDVLVQEAPFAGGELSALYDDILDSSHMGTAERKQILDALTSGSITMLADSQRRGVVNHTNNLRNRVIQMGHAQGIETEATWNAWIEAEGSYNDISGDDAAGYEFNTWGGTVGANADVGHFSFGAAVSAAYGDLTADSADHAEGNNDTITASAFLRHQKGNWVQMGILSIGFNELEMERTVGDYKATGDTNGMTVTAYYEAGYTYTLNEDCTQLIQPLVSLMLTSAQMDGFTESGSIGNAALVMEDEDYVYGTLGIGARYQAVLSQDINERLSFIELRAKIVQDFGDDTHEATVRFAGAPGSSFLQQGTEVGSFGFQFGAGISVPLGLQTTVFADVDADIRDNATSVSGGVGVRVAF